MDLVWLYMVSPTVAEMETGMNIPFPYITPKSCT